MPEGDVAWRYAHRLDDALTGAVLSVTDFRVPQLATADLAGREVAGVIPRGKHMLTRIQGGITLHVHLRMDGEWRLYRPGSRFHGPAGDIRLVLGNEAWRAVGYRLPVVELLPTGDEQRVVGHLGPDLLGPDWDEAAALRRLGVTPDREIGDALLDQRNLAGIGNLYKCEVLFLRGVSPWCPVGETGDVPALVRLAKRLLEANKDRTGQVTTGSARRGEETWVYGRGGRPCRRCGMPIARSDQAGAGQQRITFWCPSCQPGYSSVQKQPD